jgi:hypothetical protein
MNPEGTEITIPKEDPGAVPMKVQKAGDKSAKKEFDRILDDIRKTRGEDSGKPENIALPEIPKPPTPWKEDAEIWKQVEDATLDQLEWQVILYALHQLNSMSQEEIKQRVAKDNVVPADFMEHPEDYRGKFVSITGTLMNMGNQYIDSNRSGLTQYWDGLIYNQRHKTYRWFYYYYFDKDREWFSQQDARNRDLTRNGDLVTINGIFIKLYRNCTEGGATVTYPFIIGRRFEPAKGLTMKGQWQFSWGILTVIGVVIGGVFIFLFVAMRRDRKESDSFLHSRKHKKAGLVNNEQLRQVTAKAKGKGASETKEEPTLDSLGKPQPEEKQAPSGEADNAEKPPDKGEDSGSSNKPEGSS